MTGSEKSSQPGDGHQPVSTQRKTESSSTMCEELKKVTDDGDRPTPGQSAAAPAYRRHGWENAEIPQPDQQHWTCPAAQTAGETALETGHLHRASGCRRGNQGTPILSLSPTHGKPTCGSSPPTTAGPGRTTLARTHSSQNVKREREKQENKHPYEPIKSTVKLF